MSEKMKAGRAGSPVDAVLRLCGRPGAVAILMQDNPDPDALGSAAALRELIRARLGKRVMIGYGGVCGRAENRAMIDILRLDGRRVTPAHLDKYRTLCLVDCQPHAGNNLLRADREADVVIDHHLLPRRKPWTAAFADVRPEYGATATILYEYLNAAGVEIDANLATAMFYAIQSDTQDLGREAEPADVRAYQELFSLADKKKLARIRHAPVQADYFKMFADSLANCVVAGKTVVSWIPACNNVDVIAEVADRMMRLDGMQAAVCYGACANTLYLSARATDARGNVARRIKRVVRNLGTGGGHATMAGGQVPLNSDGEKRTALVRARILSVFAPNQEPAPLLAGPAKRR